MTAILAAVTPMTNAWLTPRARQPTAGCAPGVRNLSFRTQRSVPP